MSASLNESFLKSEKSKCFCPAQDAVVIGERSNQVFLSTPIKTATTFGTNSDPIPFVRSLLAKNPAAKLFALVDPQHVYCMQHYMKNKDWLALHRVATAKLPSFGNGQLVEVALCSIRILKPPPPETVPE